MAYRWQRWLVDELRAAVKEAGLDVKVIPVQGWQNRGRPASTGNFDPNGPSTTHHTGTTTSPTRLMPTLGTLIEGRAGLPGPLSQVGVAYNGDIYVIAAGRANHAGRVGKSGVPGMPLGADGNALAIGDEVDTNGTQALPEKQRRSIALINAVVLNHFDRPDSYAHRHEDISGTGKWDIGQLTTREVRADAAEMRRIIKEGDDMATADEVWAEKLHKWEPGDKDPKDTMGAGQQLNQTRGWSKDTNERIKRLENDMETALRLLRELTQGGK
jgi:hypothetical protein